MRRRNNTQDDSRLSEPPQRPDHDSDNEDDGQGQPDDSAAAEPEPVSRQQSLASSAGRPDTPPVQQQTNKHRRFSILRFRNASDSQLSLRAKQQAEAPPPPVPRRTYTLLISLSIAAQLNSTPLELEADTCVAPEIITTAPTEDINVARKKPSKLGLSGRFRFSSDLPRDDPDAATRSLGRRTFRKSFHDERGRPSLMTLEEPPPSLPQPSQSVATSNGVALHASVPRQSESSRSDASSAEPTSQAGSNTHLRKAASAKPPLFRLRMGRKDPEPLFPLSHLPHKNKSPPDGVSSTSLGVSSTPRPASVHSSGDMKGRKGRSEDTQKSHPSPAAALFAPSGSQSGHSSPTRANFLRGRSSTLSSVGRDSTDDHLLPHTTRTSSSTGRKSFGDLLGLSRLRQNSELSRQGTMTPITPGSIGSKSNSLQLTRESMVLPERQEEESAAKFLSRVEEIFSRSMIAAALSKGSDAFSAAVLRSYMRTFSYFGDPMDIALRKLLMEAELPKETQHIDRFLQAFANRYHECNPGIYSSPDQAYFLAFSLLILHTDVFNKNNKHKMQKADYIKNTRGEGIIDDILDYFYDNICYTPFIRVDDDIDLSIDRLSGSKSKRKPLLTAGSSADTARRAAKEPVDPYLLILEGSLDVLRPNLRDAMHLDDHYNYLGTAPGLNLKDLQKTFFRTGVLQIVSARSRPDAFMTEKTKTNPDEAHPGIVDIKVTKVGLLWRKDVKKRKTRSPWQEWGAILTGAQLYFFRNTGWIKSLMHQYESHIRGGNDGIPIIFKPPLEQFKPDALKSTQNAIALVDTSYKKHKNAFVYVGQGGLDEILLADNEDELNDWLAKLNYAAAFSSSGVRMRGVVGGHYDGQGRRGIRRLDGPEASRLVQTPTGPVSIVSGAIDHKMADDIQIARRDVMRQKIEEGEQRIDVMQRQLDEQLRNARHLHILAPIQPRTREQLLSSAARMSARLRWTRTDIWREKCHLEILLLDLNLDGQMSDPSSTPTKQRQDPEGASSPTPRASVMHQDSKSSRRSGNYKNLRLSHISGHGESPDMESPFEQVFQTPPQSATRTLSGSDAQSIGRESISSASTSPLPSPMTNTQMGASSADEPAVSEGKSALEADDVDADERDFLRKAGLIAARLSKEGSQKSTRVSSAEGIEHVTAADRDRADKNKVRRSLQRTLREGAGQLSHHRSRKGKEPAHSATVDDTARDSMLARGTGSFVVHGKKASVIQLGSELQNMSRDEKLRARIQQQQQPHHNDQLPSPMLSGGEDDDFRSAVAVSTSESNEASERRESAASASTATARSFRELHRKYSSAQAARSVSGSGRLALPSDGESEAAVSISDGRRSPLPPIENESQDEGDDSSEEQAETGGKVEGEESKAVQANKDD